MNFRVSGSKSHIGTGLSSKTNLKFFRLISLGHVPVCPDPADRYAMLIQNQFGFVLNPFNRAPRLDDTKPERNVRLVRKLARGGGLVSGSLRFTRGAIVGMKESEESFPD